MTTVDDPGLWPGAPAPAFEGENIAVFLVSDNNYAPYLGVTLASLAANAAPGNNYDLLVLDDGLSRFSREKVSQPLKAFPNLSLSFVDLRPFFADIDPAHLNTTLWPRAAYGRLFAQTIFAHYERIVYLDCDVTVMADIADLFRTEMGSNLVAGVRDYGLIDIALRQGSKESYYREVLGLSEVRDYINSGVLVLNLAAMRADNLEARFRELIRTIPAPLSPDQDIINVACQGRIKHLDFSWNAIQFIVERPELLSEWAFIPRDLSRRETLAAQQPKIVHFTGNDRPWKAKARYTQIGHYFWRYARLTPYYEELIIYGTPDFDLVKTVFYRHKYWLRYWRYKLLAALPFKALKRKYQHKLAIFSERLNRCRRMLD